MPKSVIFSTSINGQTRVGRVINVGQINAATVSFGASGTARASLQPSLLVPPQPFVDRDAERTVLAEKLRRGESCLLCGLGGVGKSALALRVAHDLAAEGAFPGGVFWLPLEDAPSPDVAAARLVSALGETATTDPLGALPRLLYGLHVLLVLDSAETALDSAEEILLRRSPTTTVLITSRDARVGATVIPGVPDDLAPLEPDDAADLLRVRLRDPLLADEQAAEICDLVGGLPLALVLAAAFMTRELRGSPDPAAEYLKLLRATPLVALQMGDRRNNSIRVTFDLSCRHLNDAARRALAVLAYVPSDSVDAAAVAAGMDASEEAAKTALRDLTRLSLTGREGDRYRTHPLVRYYARQQGDAVPAAGIRVGLQRYYLAYAQMYKDDRFVLKRERDNLLGVMNWIWEKQDWQQVITSVKVIKFYLQQDESKLAYEWVKRWLEAARRLRDRVEEVHALESLGDLHMDQAEYKDAQRWYGEALPIYDEIGDRPGKAKLLMNLAETHRISDVHEETEKARQMYEEVLSIYREIGDRQGKAKAMMNLGEMHRRLDEYFEARQWYGEALSICREIGDRQGELNASRNLGDVHFGLREDKKALLQYEGALLIYQEMGDWLGKADMIKCMGDVHRLLGEYGAARERYGAALGVYQEIGARLGEANVLHSLGELAETQEDWPAAAAWFRRALDVYGAIGSSYARVTRKNLDRVQSRL